MSVDRDRGPEGAGRPADGSSSRPSKTNRHGPSDPPETAKIDSADMGATALRPLSVDGDRDLRDECLLVETDDGHRVPLTAPNVTREDGRVISRPWYKVVNQQTEWYKDYENSHIEYENPDGETVRAPLRNSYQPDYGNVYYARLMDLKRGVERRWSDDFSIVMLTLSASTLNANGQPRAPADHMRDIADGWKTARKQLYDVLSDYRSAYARVWEPTSSDGDGPAGYGHQHIAIFVEDGDDLDARDFRPVMESYVNNTTAAGWDAHRPAGDGVSVTHELEEANAATYVSEYIGQYGEELYDRPVHERAFLAVAWATGTRRVEFDATGQGLIRGEEFRRETGLRPEDRGEATDRQEDAQDGESDDESDGEGDGWEFVQFCEAHRDGPEYYQPAGGGVSRTHLDGAGGDPPRDMGPAPAG